MRRGRGVTLLAALLLTCMLCALASPTLPTARAMLSAAPADPSQPVDICNDALRLSPGLPAAPQPLHTDRADTPLRAPTLLQTPSQPAIPATVERVSPRVEGARRASGLTVAIGTRMLPALPMARRDANGRVVTRWRYVRSVYQVFRADMVGG